MISPEYLEQIRLMHSQRVWGDGGHKYHKQIKALAKSTRSQTLLDYGCGTGTLAKYFKEIAEYDPGIEGKDALPAPADLVICTDVLEHIEPEYVDAVLDHIFELTKKAAYFVVSTRPAHSFLPNGQNAHLTIKRGQWWVKTLRKRAWRIVVDSSDAGEVIMRAWKK